MCEEEDRLPFVQILARQFEPKDMPIGSLRLRAEMNAPPMCDIGIADDNDYGNDGDENDDRIDEKRTAATATDSGIGSQTDTPGGSPKPLGKSATSRQFATSNPTANDAVASASIAAATASTATASTASAASAASAASSIAETPTLAAISALELKQMRERLADRKDSAYPYRSADNPLDFECIAKVQPVVQFEWPLPVGTDVTRVRYVLSFL